MNEMTIKEGKNTAIIAYLTIIGCIIALFMNQEPKNMYARMHIRQAFGIHITYFLLGFLVSMFNSWFISAPFYIFVIVLWGFGFINALQGVSQPVPLVGKKFQQWFTFIQ